jgi:hypothetical protein
MNEGKAENLQGVVVAMVEQYGLVLLVDAVLALASGENIEDIAERVERRAIRLAADAEANLLLK